MAVARRVRWTTAVPVAAVLLLAVTWGSKPPGAVLAVLGLFLAGSVLAAVHHAEVVAHRVGEPFGSLVLAVAVTVIEVAPDRHADGLRRRARPRRWRATPCSRP